MASKKKTDFAKTLPFDKERDYQAREKIKQARITMLIAHGFWGTLATRMKLINADEWCSTLATDGKNFYYNSDFVNKLGNDKKVVFGLAHEILHCVYDHIGRTKDRNKQLSNIAQDYVINADLVHHGIGQRIDEIDIVFDMKYHNWNWEAVYDDLLKNATIIEIEGLGDKVLDDHLDKKTPGDGSGDGDADGDEDGKSTKRPTLSKEEQEKIKEEFRNAVIEAAKNSDPGKLPLGVQRLVKDLTEPQLDWKSIITMKIPSLTKNDYTFQRANKKHMHSGFILPSMNREEAIDVCVVVDTSGSISQKQLNEVLSEVVGLMNMYEEFTLRIWQHDTAVYGYEEFTKDTASDLLNYEIRGGGGTSFMVNWDFMKKEGIEPKLMIWFTDGESFDGWGDESYCSDVIWIINNPYNPKIEAPFGTTVYY